MAIRQSLSQILRERKDLIFISSVASGRNWSTDKYFCLNRTKYFIGGTQCQPRPTQIRPSSTHPAALTLKNDKARKYVLQLRENYNETQNLSAFDKRTASYQDTEILKRVINRTDDYLQKEQDLKELQDIVKGRPRITEY